jgi:hypothetical protein
MPDQKARSALSEEWRTSKRPVLPSLKEGAPLSFATFTWAPPEIRSPDGGKNVAGSLDVEMAISVVGLPLI